MQHTNIYIEALEAEQQGDWKHAYELVQSLVTAEAAWVQAYLYRVKGDNSEAEFWYNRAVQPMCHSSLAAEWNVLYQELKDLGDA